MCVQFGDAAAQRAFTRFLNTDAGKAYTGLSLTMALVSLRAPNAPLLQVAFWMATAEEPGWIAHACASQEPG